MGVLGCSWGNGVDIWQVFGWVRRGKTGYVEGVEKVKFTFTSTPDGGPQKTRALVPGQDSPGGLSKQPDSPPVLSVPVWVG